MAVLTPQAISLPALAPNYVAAAVGGDKVQINNGDRTFLHVKKRWWLEHQRDPDHAVQPVPRRHDRGTASSPYPPPATR
jgi:hypothetical protein